MKKIAAFLLVVLALPISAIYANESVYLGGDSVGIVGKYEGVFISGTFPFTINEEKVEPSQSVHVQDLIIEVNNVGIHSFSDLKKELNKYQNIYNEVPITIIRNNNPIKTKIITSYKNEKVEHGLYLKEKVLGVGTITFYNSGNRHFGALGHPITNEGNEYLQKGEIYESDIVSIKPSTSNSAGDKSGNIDYEKKIGDIEKNTDIGVYGSYISDIKDKEKLEIAEESEIHIGPAYFYTVLEANKIEKFSIDITSIKKDLANEKAIEFTITDNSLLSRSGGIVHGMSGSPIVQDGKLIAAITHVILDDPKSGYAIYIKNMYNITQNMN